jgi:carbon-monoxide dehydrogenase medium subunit
MRNFIYKKACILEEACKFLAQYREKAKILAGGTDLIVKMKQNLVHPEVLVDIKGISGFDGIKYDLKEGLTIGTLTSIRSIEMSSLIREKFPVIWQSAELLGSVQTRNRATIGGNLCNASPSAEMAPCLMVLNAKARIVGNGTERDVLLRNFFIGPGTTVLSSHEILLDIRIPNIGRRTGCKYIKHSIRSAMDLAIASVAVALILDERNQRCKEIRIVLGGVAPFPMWARETENRLRGQIIDECFFEEASRLVSEEIRPIADFRASAEYRKEIVKVITEKAIRQAMDSIV